MRFATFPLLFLVAAVPALTAPTCVVDNNVHVECQLPTLADLRSEACAQNPKSHLCARLSNGTATASASAHISAARASASAARHGHSASAAHATASVLSLRARPTAEGAIERRVKIGSVISGVSKAGGIVNTICGIFGEVCQDVEGGVEGFFDSIF